MRRIRLPFDYFGICYGENLYEVCRHEQKNITGILAAIEDCALMFILLINAKDVTDYIYNALLESLSQRYCRNFHSPFQKIFDYRKQSAIDVNLKIYLHVSIVSYNMCCELGRQTSDLYRFSKHNAS